MLRKSQIEGKTLQPPLAYGDLGRKPDIPPDSRITYLFGLLHFEKQKEMAEMTWAQVEGDFEPLDFSQSDILLWYDNDAMDDNHTEVNCVTTPVDDDESS